MTSCFNELTNEETMQVEGGNPVVVYGIIAVGKYVVIPAAKVFAEAVVMGFAVKAISDLCN